MGMRPVGGEGRASSYPERVSCSEPAFSPSGCTALSIVRNQLALICAFAGRGSSEALKPFGLVEHVFCIAAIRSTRKPCAFLTQTTEESAEGLIQSADLSAPLAR